MESFSTAEPDPGPSSTEDLPTPPAPEASVEELLASPRWAQAARLVERLALAEPIDEADFDVELARRRRERWRAQPPLDQDRAWQRRLEALASSTALASSRALASSTAERQAIEERFERVLGESTDSLHRRFSADGPLPWVEALADAYGEEGCFEPFAWPAATEKDRNRFTALFEPLLWRAHGRATAAARASLDRHGRLDPDGGSPRSAAPFEPAEAVRLASAYLPSSLAPLLNRAMLVEMHIAKLEERLDGDSPEARFENFVASLRRPERALAVLEGFPVLGRLLVDELDQWQGAVSQLLEHLAADAPALAQRFHGGRPLGRLCEIGGGVSDSHRNGRGVLLLRFDSGLRLVYKPKPMAIELAFQGLLDWLGERGFEPRLRSVEVLDGGDHGWMEWVEAAACPDEPALRRCYRRLGAQLALLYVLDGTDFHHENLIAAGEHPVPIDLETLFQPWVAASKLRDVEGEPGAPLRSSVQRTNLLPERWWARPGEAGVDLSGLGSQEGQLTPSAMLVATEIGTDSMRMERQRIEIPVGNNRPRLEGREETVLDYRPELVSGFRDLYDLLVEHRDELLADDGPLAAFSGTEMRVLVRTTAGYGHLLLESFHPHVMGNALERDRLFDRMWNISGHRTWLDALLPTELEEMARNDVPLFLTEPDSLDLRTWDGRCFAEIFDQSGLDRVRARIRSLGARDRARQEALIGDSLDALHLELESLPRSSYEFTEGSREATKSELLDSARRVAERLLDRAFVNQHEALWLGIDHTEGSWQVVPTTPDGYRGQPGIAFFLGYYGAVAGDAESTDVARKAIRAMERQIEVDPSLVFGLGGYNGWGGVIHSLVHLGVLWKDGELLDRAVAHCLGLLDEVENDTVLDFLAGSAGLASVVLALAQLRPSSELDALLRAAGDRLLATAVGETAGHGWPMSLVQGRTLAGISHGAAGIALSLLRLHGAFGDERYRSMALEGLAFERHLFSPEEGNWPDLRVDESELGEGEEDRRFMLAWCHGAPGIGQARIAGLPYLDDAEVRREIRHAVDSTLAGGFGTNHSLCHGDLGNLDFLLDAALALGDRQLEQRVYRLARGVLDGIAREGWLFGLPGSVETPGLMVGLAGIGHGLLRLAAPEQVPSALTLSPPPGLALPTLPPTSAREAGLGARP